MVSHWKKPEADDILKKLTDAVYADDLALFANTLSQTECLLSRLEKAAGDIGLYMGITKIEYMCFKQEVVIFTLSAKPIRLLDHFTYLGSHISSTKNDVNIHSVKV